MKNILKTFLIVAALMGAMPVAAQQMSELTKAMFKAYEQALELDPQDYITYYRRAVEYFRLGEYERSEIDLADAMKYTPAKEADLMAHEYALQAEIFRAKGEYNQALTAIDKALTIDPKSYANLYMKGNIYLEMKEGEDAYRTFKQMLTLRSRSQEAFFGMARACVMTGNLDEARSLVEEAKNVDSSSALTYCRLGDINRDMGENDKATLNYITAVSLGKDIQRPIAALEDIALTDYDAYDRGFDYAIAQSGSAGESLAYIRGIVSSNTGHYQDAYEVLKGIADKSNDLSAAFLTRLAQSCLYLDKLPEARSYADRALSIDPIAEAYLVKSAIELADNQPANAILFASKAYLPADPDTESLIAQAKGYIAKNSPAEAITALNEAILIDGECLPALLLRAYTKEYLQNDKSGAKSDLERASNIDAKYFPEIAYKAMAQTLSGKTLDGESTIDAALKRDSSADAYAGAAIYYAQTGNKEKAEEYRDKALDAGCENVFLLKSDKTPYLSFSGSR